MDLTSTDDSGFISGTYPAGPSVIPWDDPYPFFKDMPEQDDAVEMEEGPVNIVSIEPVAEEPRPGIVKNIFRAASKLKEKCILLGSRLSKMSEICFLKNMHLLFLLHVCKMSTTVGLI